MLEMIGKNQQIEGWINSSFSYTEWGDFFTFNTVDGTMNCMHYKWFGFQEYVTVMSVQSLVSHMSSKLFPYA